MAVSLYCTWVNTTSSTSLFQIACLLFKAPITWGAILPTKCPWGSFTPHSFFQEGITMPQSSNRAWFQQFTLFLLLFIHYKSHLGDLFFTLYLRLTVVFILTSQPGHTVGFGRWSVNSEGFSGKCFFVFWFLYQVSDFSHEPVKESWQHSRATNNYQVLCQLLPGVYWTLMQKGIKKF